MQKRKEKTDREARNERRGVIVILAAIMLVMVLSMVAFAVDIGFMMVIRTQLQVAADSGAMAAGNALYLEADEIKALARDYVTEHSAGGRKVTDGEADIEFGIWDVDTDTFTPSADVGNALRVTARRTDAPFFFARVMGKQDFTMEAEAIAMVNPRDIAFVVDLSGSMNDDAEPAWATATVNKEFGSKVGDQVMMNVYADFGYGAFPGKQQHVGSPLGVKSDKWAYAELTDDGGPLTDASVDSKYRIQGSDNEKTRKQKAYQWMIDNQIAKVMPAAKPTPNSANYSYWEKYLDYIIQPVKIKAPTPPKPKPAPTPTPPSTGGPPSGGGGSTGGGGSPGGTPTPAPNPTPPPPPKPKPPTIGRWVPGAEPAGRAVLATVANDPGPWFTATRAFAWGGVTTHLMLKPGTPPVDRGWLPPSQDGDRIHKFNNPNRATFPKAKSNLPKKLRNKIGYQTYVQFMMDHGRDLKPNGTQYVPLSVESPDCPFHTEGTPAGNFSFPPREQPMHAVRRSLIAAMNVALDRNDAVPGMSNRDHVAIVSYDSIQGNKKPVVHQQLTGDYKQAMFAVTKLQAVGDKGASTTTDAGLRVAADILTSKSKGGNARDTSEKIAVLLTDGIPNDFEGSEGGIDDTIDDIADSQSEDDNDIDDIYGGGYYWLDAPLIRTRELRLENRAEVYPVGVGLGTDYEFMDRVARIGGTANAAGQSPRGSGDPEEYEQILTEIFEKIITSPTARLVQ
ncbi:MAG: TadG family pilus assembly protein [Planctomycetota bacterium]